jgi:hypothetical protein
VRLLVVTALVAVALVLPPFESQPASAAPSAVRVALTQSSADSAIGSELTLTATVIWSGGASPQPPGGWYVEFTGSADGGWSSGPIQTVGSVATYHRTSPIAQTETITARLATPGCSAESTPVTHEWWEPEITLDEEDATTPVNVAFELTGFVTRGADPVPGATVRVTVTSFAPDPDDPYDIDVVRDETVLEATTADGGEFAVSLPGRPPSIDKIVATATTAGGFSARTVTTHSWSDADSATQSLTLTADSEARVPDELLAIAQFRPADAAAGIRFLTDQGWMAPNTESSAGEARYNYAGQPAEDWAGLGVRTSPTGLHRARIAYWWQPIITFVAPDSRSVNGQSYPATVVVTGRGTPIADMRLAFTARGNGTQYATTDAEGIATVPIIGQAGESLTIDVEESADESVPATGSTTHTWANSPAANAIGVTLDPRDNERSESRVGTEVPFVARVTSGGNPSQNWDVTFAIDGEELGTVATDAVGEAVMPVSRATESYSQITATVAIAGCGVQAAQVNHYWWASQLDLTPKATTSPARRDVTFTAEVARTVFDDFEEDPADGEGVAAAAIPEGMVALPDQLIRFTMSSQSCVLPVVVREDRTGDDGIAAVTLSRDGPTIDSVRAEEVGVFDPAVDTTTHTWGIPETLPLSIALSQSSEVSRAGTAVTFTATVHDTDGPDGQARAGVPVTFLGVSPSRTALTNSEGVARMTLPGTGTAPTAVTASAPFGCGVVLSGPITHRPFVPTLELSPTIATSTTGETATVIARLSNGPAPVIGQAIELTIDSSTPGESTRKLTRPSRGDGTAEFSWTRTKAGTDDLVAVEVVRVLPQQDSATHIWEDPPPPVTPPPVTPPPVTPPPVTPPPNTPPAITPPPPDITETPGTEPTTDDPSEPSEAPTSPPPPPPSEPPNNLPATSTLVDGPEVGRPGADIQVSGTGCSAGQTLSVLLGDTELGTTRAAADGTFYLRAVVPDLPLGRYIIHSTCGKTIGDPNVDITSPQVDKAIGAIAAVGVTTASTFAFFLLIAKGVISFLPRRPM